MITIYRVDISYQISCRRFALKRLRSIFEPGMELKLKFYKKARKFVFMGHPPLRLDKFSLTKPV